MSFDEIAQSVRINNRDISSGSIKTDTEELLIRSNAKNTDVVHFENIIVRSLPDGSVVRLGDIATVKLTFSETSKSFLF